VDRNLLDEQIAYYRARAPEYDEWFFRQGRYDRGEAHRLLWQAEVTEIEAALREAGPSGRVLELACGTGLWTRRLVESADEVTAIDSSPEVIEINRDRVGSDCVRYVEADLFTWSPARAFDFVFFGFWLSHVPPDRFESFWATVHAALKPGGLVFFVDNANDPDVTARDHVFPAGDSVVMDRSLNDGRPFRVVKVLYDPAELQERLAGLGWHGYVRTSGRFFVHGSVRRDDLR
jgi:demethylmenaquinone methyltransferase/2-methoxy-6-polyprenyl-1,4-benzoquinol methylase